MIVTGGVLSGLGKGTAANFYLYLRKWILILDYICNSFISLNNRIINKNRDDK